MIHNETTNVWSHILGTLIFVWFAIYVAIYLGNPVNTIGGTESVCPAH
jgi:predicted membrane channel-forming protein YqfA (hemolysin III family)